MDVEFGLKGFFEELLDQRCEHTIGPEEGAAGFEFVFSQSLKLVEIEVRWFVFAFHCASGLGYRE